MEYQKINSIYKRTELDRTTVDRSKVPPRSLIMGDYSCPEFGLIKHWQVEEKIDGTNIRIVYDPHAEQKITILGRQKDSKVPKLLYEFLKYHFTIERLSSAFNADTTYTLYGEGYGNNIQSAGPKYSKNVRFMLFDVRLGDIWLSRQEVKEKADQLELPFPPQYGYMTEKEVIELVSSRPNSLCSDEPQIFEGIIARTEPYIFLNTGIRIMWKLKVKDIR